MTRPTGSICGADGYLIKPFAFVVLVARLRAAPPWGAGTADGACRRNAPSRPSRRVVREDAEITLTAREYALLEYLMRRQDQVVTKIELLDRVWDAGADTDPNVVEVYVGYLRRKIDQPFGRHSLQTVRGAGYRLFDETRADASRGASGADPIDDIDEDAFASEAADTDSVDAAETGAGRAPAPREG